MSKLLKALAAVIGLAVWVAAQTQTQVGYCVLTSDVGSSVPVGSALFSYRNSSGVLVSEAGVGAAEAIRSGRIFVDEIGTRTGIALVNPSAQTANVTLILRDSAGDESARTQLPLAARQHVARYVSELFTSRPSNFTGSLTFESDQALTAVTLRESQNAQQEPLYTTLPVLDLNAAAGDQAVVFPHIAAGEGYATQLVLINRGSQTLRGRVNLIASDGRPLALRFQGNTVTDFSYQIEPQGTYRAELDSVSGLGVGYATLTPDPGNTAPTGSAIFQFKADRQLVTEAGVAAISATTAARVFVDYISTQTGVAIANSGDLPTELTVTLMDRYGFVEAGTTQTLPARSHLARFVHELFPGVTDGYSGLMEIRSSRPIVSVALKLTVNARNNAILTTLPVADLTRSLTSASLVFPHIALGGGFTTRLIVLNPNTSNSSNGSLTFYQPDGDAMVVPMGDRTGSQFGYQMVQGGGRQFFPGNNARVASVSLVESSSNQVTNELVINEGNTVRPRLQVLDSAGARRDDFDATFTSLDSNVAAVDGLGSIQGRKAGFSTLTIAVGGVLTAATAAVIKVDSGVSGFTTTGIAQDFARRLYLASTQDHTILLAQDLKQTPQVYAGVPRTAGLKDDLRLQSQFRNPAFLAMNQGDGTLFVSDGANHVIRRVRPGPQGKTETLAGTGVAGSRDGPLSEAMFDNPQGVALDDRGNLWVVDSGNHVVRRINLVTRVVQTIAGKAGTAGLADGAGEAARFRSPVGIAIESESAVQQLERMRTGQAPPPVQVLVADTGNGVIRRVKENGDVQTILSATAGDSGLTGSDAAPIRFSSPTGLGIDALGNIYVTEPTSRQLKVILQNGAIAVAAQSNTFSGPRGIAITESGRIVVADSDRSAREISYGEPAISGITPDRVSNRGGATITVKGTNFAAGTVVIVAGIVVSGARIMDTQTISFEAPPFPSGRTTVTVQNRGGLAQTSLLVEPTPLSQLQSGQITTVAGGTTFIGDGSAARSASIAFPEGMALDAAGNLYIADTPNNRIRKAAARTGIITTVAGTGIYGSSGDGGLATLANLAQPIGIAVDAAGNLFVGDTGNQRIRRIDARTGIITTVAGNGETGFSGDDGVATGASFYRPSGIAVDTAGNLFIADFGNRRVRRVDAATRIITTVAGNGREDFFGDNGPARQAALASPTNVAVDSAGNIFIADLHRIRSVAAGTGIITTVAGQTQFGNSGDGGAATGAFLNVATGISVDASGNLFISDSSNQRVRKVDAATRVITTIAGTGEEGFSGDNGPATSARLSFPVGALTDGAGNVLIADLVNSRIRRVDVTTGTITTFVGNGLAGSSGDGGPATAAALNFPEGLAFDGSGALYVVDSGSHRVRRVDPTTGIITTVVGTGQPGSGGDGGPATRASLTQPVDIAADASGNLYIVDTGSQRIRRVDSRTGVITTIAGTDRQNGFSGDNGPATAAALNYPSGVAVDLAGNTYIADSYNHRIRRVAATTGTITTIAGNGQPMYAGDGGRATDASLRFPGGIAVDSAGNLFIADLENFRVRRVDSTTGIITTVAGTGVIDSSGDGGPARNAGLVRPQGVVVDRSGNLFIADYLRVRKVAAATGIITTVAGTGDFGFGGDNGTATAALVDAVRVAVDPQGNLHIADRINHRIRAVKMGS